MAVTSPRSVPWRTIEPIYLTIDLMRHINLFSGRFNSPDDLPYKLSITTKHVTMNGRPNVAMALHALRARPRNAN